VGAGGGVVSYSRAMLRLPEGEGGDPQYSGGGGLGGGGDVRGNRVVRSRLWRRCRPPRPRVAHGSISSLGGCAVRSVGLT